ncbi:MAG: DUF3592 domain-containing protein [Anaerolineales bacterium]|nr:DUF3592 domain-containing protein [Anaerolineales bacterium]
MDKFFGILLVVIGTFIAFRSFWLRTNGTSTLGKVISVTVGRGRHLSISFKTNNKKTFIFSSGILSLFTYYEVGDSIPVLYNPANPATVVINNFDAMWLLPSILLGSGFLILFTSIR